MKSKESVAAYQARYQASIQGKLAVAKHRASAKGKASGNKYHTSPKGKATRARYNARRRSNLKTALINDFTSEQWAVILQEHNHTCHYCQQTKKLTRDHVIPISKGGNHTASNIVPACQSCNSKKGSKV